LVRGYGTYAHKKFSALAFFSTIALGARFKFQQLNEGFRCGKTENSFSLPKKYEPNFDETLHYHRRSRTFRRKRREHK
jgi:hypothetical protein